METVQGETLRGETITLAKAFRNCTFVDCKMIYEGAPVQLHDCKFINCGWSIEGSARHTIYLLHALWKSGGADVVQAAGVAIAGAPLQFID
jgi:hypothetical protein